MENWFDKEQIWCIACKHRWILISNKQITQEQHDIWVRAVMEHHKLIQEEKEQK